MVVTGTDIWPWNQTDSDKFTQALYATMPVKPINIRVTSTEFQPQNRRRRNLLQVRRSCPAEHALHSSLLEAVPWPSSPSTRSWHELMWPLLAYP